MRKENNNEEPFGNFFEGADGFSDNSPDIPSIEVNFNPFLDDIRPFNILWNEEKVKNYLIARGYKIITRKNSSGDEIELAVKPNQELLPIDSEENNILEVFEDDIQGVILSWLLKISKTND